MTGNVFRGLQSNFIGGRGKKASEMGSGENGRKETDMVKGAEKWGSAKGGMGQGRLVYV